MDKHRAVPRVVLIVALIVLSLGWSLADLRRVVGAPIGSFGFSSAHSSVTEVDQGGVAARAGIRVGDQIAIRDHSPVAQYELGRGVAPNPGVVLSAIVTSSGTTRPVRLVAQPEAASERAFVALRFALAFLTIGVATALLLTRPDVASWGFFIYCLTVISLPGATLSMALPWSVRTLSLIPASALINAGYVGGAIFAFAFARSRLDGWRRNAIVVLAAAAAADTIIVVYNAYTGAFGVLSAKIDFAFDVVALLLMLVGFIDSLRQDSGAARQRLRWMIAALVVSIPANYLTSWYFPGFLTYGQYVGLIALQGILPLTAAYALFRTRVVDLNFVISRTLVYATLTAAVVVVFSILDAVLARTFAESQVSLTIDITVALMLGFSLNAAHRRVDDVIDRVLFRDRHRAEMQLENAAAGVVHASDEKTVTETLVRLPVHALRLSGSAVYRRAGGAYALSAVGGGLTHVPQGLDANDALVLALRAGLQPLRIDSVPLSSLREAHGPAEPVVAIPVAMRGELDGFAVYAAHENGADIDPDEERALKALALNAAVAYDHLEVAVLRARVSELEAAISPAS